jgi:nucleoside-diphosphate-sugar epimerase
MRLAVTGGTGFIGRRLVRILRGRGHDVVCVVRNPDKAGELSALGATLARGDILDGASLKEAFSGCDGVFHLAASYELGVVGKRAKQALAKNLEGTRVTLEAARDSGAKKIVYTSSTVIYGNTRGQVVPEGTKLDPLEFPSFYAMSKARAHYEVAVPLMEAGAPIVIVQPGAVFGPQDHSIFRFIWSLLGRGLPVVMGGCQYGVVYVEDCAMGHALAMEKGKPGECYHLVDQNLRLADMVKRTVELSGIKGRALVLPDWLLALNAALMSVVERVIPVVDLLSSDALHGMPSSFTLIVAPDKARKELGWEPGSMDDALREVMAAELTRLGKKLPPQLEGVRPRLSQ